jgi:fumarate hydratase class II
MGIGAAFAMGLVSGFTRNIEQEKQRRLADEQKVDLLEQQLFKSALEGDATNAGIEAASSLIKSSRTKLQDRKPIDLFGTQTDGIDLDFTSMKSSIDNVSKYGTSFGTGANVFGTSVDINDSPNTAKSYLFLNEAESLLNDESVLAKIAAGGQTVQDEFIAKIKGSYGIIMRDAT